jgi:uncharacterized membrane protein
MSAVQYEHRNEDLVACAWNTLYIALISLSPVLLSAVLISDGLYWLTAATICARVSEWLLGAGSGTGLMAAADGLIRHVRMGGGHRTKIRWMLVIGKVVSLLLSMCNLTYRLIEGAGSSIVPAGIALTGTVVCLLIATAGPGVRLSPEAAHDDPDDGDLF